MTDTHTEAQSLPTSEGLAEEWRKRALDKADQCGTLRGTLDALQLAADEINGEIDRQTCDEKRALEDWPPEQIFDVSLTARHIEALNIAIFAAQRLLKTLALRAQPNDSTPSLVDGLAEQYARDAGYPADAVGAEDLVKALAASNEGYKDAFYQIAELLGIPAQAKSPREVFETQMFPALQAALRAQPAEHEGLAVAWQEYAGAFAGSREFAADYDGFVAGYSAALRAQPSNDVEGWREAPREPTPEMIARGLDEGFEDNLSGHKLVSDVWCAMWDAAPGASVQAGGEVERP